MGLLKYEKNIPDDPKVRTFDGLQRDENGFFDDQQLVNILKNAIEEPAGQSLLASHLREHLAYPVRLVRCKDGPESIACCRNPWNFTSP